MFSRLGRWCFTHRWATIGAWIAAIIVIFTIGGALGPGYSEEFEAPASDSGTGFDIIDENFGDNFGAFQSGQIVFRADAGVEDPEVAGAMQDFFAEVAALDEIAALDSPYDAQPGRKQIADEGDLAGQVAFAAVSVNSDIDQVEASQLGRTIEDLAPELDGVQIELGGGLFADVTLPNSEAIGLAFAIVVLILAFGSVLAMGLPIGVAIAGVSSGMGLVLIMSNVMSVPEFATQIGAMIGLGVGIDYALFIVTRYRESLHHGQDPLDAVALAMDTAGRAVLFAGLTVVISLLGMLVIGISFVSGLGISAAVTVTVTMTAALTLLPALLGLAGTRLEITRWRGIIAAGLIGLALLGVGLKLPPVAAFAAIGALAVIVLGLFVGALKRPVERKPPKPREETTAYRWSRLIQRHPWVSAGVGIAIMLTLAAPVLSLRLGFSDEGNFPEGTTTREAYDLMADAFGPGFNGPFLIVMEVSGSDQFPAVLALQEAVAGTDGVAEVVGPIPNDTEDPTASTAAMLQVTADYAPQDERTDQLIERLRDEVVPAAVEGTTLQPYVTGFAALALDFSSYMAERMLIFFAVVLGLSFILLMAVFRSLLVPLKAVIMNVLALAAAYGVTVAVFQWGWGGSLLGIAGAPIEPFIPMMMFAIVFGLSMDYEVFLLSRIREEYDRTGDAKVSVADGLAATARVISAAAAIMVVVFGGFLFGENRVIKLFGTGLAVAVLLDATLIRMLLVPATMELLGDGNWWLPKWLDRILPRINVEGHYLDVGEDGEGLEDEPSSEPEREPALQ